MFMNFGFLFSKKVYNAMNILEPSIVLSIDGTILSIKKLPEGSLKVYIGKFNAYSIVERDVLF